MFVVVGVIVGGVVGGVVRGGGGGNDNGTMSATSQGGAQTLPNPGVVASTLVGQGENTMTSVRDPGHSRRWEQEGWKAKETVSARRCLEKSETGEAENLI